MSDNVRCKLQKFPKDVLIEAFLRTVAFFRADDVVAECETIQHDNKFKSLMARSERISEQILQLLENESRGKHDGYDYFEWVNALQRLNRERDVIQNKIDKLLGI